VGVWSLRVKPRESGNPPAAVENCAAPEQTAHCSVFSLGSLLYLETSVLCLARGGLRVGDILSRMYACRWGYPLQAWVNKGLG